jgi:hypothetical protein
MVYQTGMQNASCDVFSFVILTGVSQGDSVGESKSESFALYKVVGLNHSMVFATYALLLSMRLSI